MLKKIILKLRNKPKPVRDRVALLGATIFTASIFVFWLYHAPARYSAIESQNLDSVADQSPGFSELFGALGETISSLKEAVADATSTATSSDESVIDLVDNPPLKDTVVVSIEKTSTTTSSSNKLATTSNDLESLFNFEGFEQYYDEEVATTQEVRIATTSLASTSGAEATQQE